jgi:hypothetical protein
VLFLLFPVAQARTAVFVSKYESRSIPDSNIANYYTAIGKIFSEIAIVQDIKVKQNSTDWTNAYINADLIFVISLNEEMLKESRSIFCGNLSSALHKMKGIVFAGNSNFFNSAVFGCPYVTYFNLASSANNNQLKNNSIKITTAHQITNGYTINKTYNIKINDSIYALVNPINGTILGTVYGDPDGSGPLSSRDSPFLVIWEGIDNRVATWALNTSDLTDCSDCLGWNLFNQLLNWVSNTSDIGFKITTDKEIYYPNDTVKIYVNSPVDIGSISGTIYYPNNQNYPLSFQGSGKERYSAYLLEKEDPSGNYNIEVVADGVKKSKMISVNALYLNLDINNQTEKVKIWANSTDFTGNIVNVNLTVNITSPKGGKSNYYFENNGSVFLTYDALESGEYTVYVKAIDVYDRIDSKTKYFSFYFKANITNVKFTPENIIEVVNGAKNLTESVTVFNNETNNVSNTQIEKLGNISSWITLKNTSLGIIESKESKTLTFDINVPDVDEGNYTGELKFLFEEGEEYKFPITIKMSYFGVLSVNPESWEGWIIRGQSKSIQFFLFNDGKGDVIIKSVNVTVLEDQISVVQKPDKIEPGGNKSLKIEIKTSDILMGGLIKKVNSALKITTDQGVYSPYINLEVNVIENIRDKVNELSLQLEELDSNITTLKKATDVSSIETKSENIKIDLEQVKSSFDQDDYENAATQYESLELSVEDLKSDIERTYIEVGKKKNLDNRIIIVLIVSVAIAVVIVFVYMKIQSEKKYNWLYNKWKSRKQGYRFTKHIIQN